MDGIRNGFIILAMLLSLLPLHTAPALAAPTSAAVSPTLNQFGFPDWYQDTTGTRLEPCLDINDPYCVILPNPGVYDPGLPLDMPDNFPDEFFYSVIDSEKLSTPGCNGTRPGKAFLRIAVEGAFANDLPADNEQMVFGRVRVRITSGLCPNTAYTFTHPFGTMTLTAIEFGGTRVVDGTQDIGCFPIPGQTCDFSIALRSPVAQSFLRWDPAVAPATPAGYLGDAVSLHRIVGSRYVPAGETEPANYFAIDGTSLRTDKFFLSGKLAGPIVSAPAALDFGNVDVLTSSPDLTVTLTNLSPNPISGFAASLSGADASQFQVTGSACAALSLDQTCSVTVRFSPTSEGSKTAVLTVSHSGLNSPVSVPLFGQAIAVPMPAVLLSPVSLTFASQAVGSVSAPQAVTVQNTGSPDPLIYKITLQVSAHAFTSSPVLPIDKGGKPTVSFDSDGNMYPAGAIRTLPPSTIYGFNGTFPGPRINAEYGKPVLIRFVNRLDENPDNLDRQDFGAPDWSFLTHLHNAHTAPESDGNPFYTMKKNIGHGYEPGTWCDNLYLNWPAGGDDSEKQSFFWFHDHRMDHTGSNVYKGMVGLYPIYDPKNNMDMGDETKGLRLPGVRTNNPDGSFDVEYDIPLAIYDCRLDDGVTLHNDVHDNEFPDAGNPRAHPEWWGKTFFKHFVNHGFVGDIFTVNGTAYPVLEVKRRKYRLRFLNASIARIYDFQLMSSTDGPKSAASLGYGGDELQGQYRIPDGQQCMKLIQIATDGGLLPAPITRNSFELWPAKRREFIVDFTRYMDGTPTKKGDVIYLTNVMKMGDGRMWDASQRFSPDPDYKVPVLKIVIGDDAPDNSVIPTALRPMPALPNVDWKKLLNNRKIFETQRGGSGMEAEWLINGMPFDPSQPARSLKNPAGKTPLAQQKLGSYDVWEIRNGGGGWVHPMHLHMEEHRVLMRNGKAVPPIDPGHPDDVSREDVIALDPGESVIIGRYFRDFVGHYVGHCHNLTHEDHAMMFGWEIVP